MAKVKFNLNLCGNRIKNLAELQCNFCIDELIDYHKDGTLTKWLEDRNHDTEKESLEKLSSDLSDEKLAKELVRIFNVELSVKELAEMLERLHYEKAKQNRKNSSTLGSGDTKEILKQYHHNYKDLIHQMLTDKDDFLKLKFHAKELAQEYFDLFALDHSSLFYQLIYTSPKAVFAILMQPNLKKIWLNQEINEEIIALIHRTLLTEESLKKNLDNHLMIFEHANNDDWKAHPIWSERGRNKSILILRLEGNVKLRSIHKPEKEYSTKHTLLDKEFTGFEYIAGDNSYDSMVKIFYLEDNDD